MRILTFFKHIFKPTKKKVIFLIIATIAIFGTWQYLNSQNSKKDEIKTVTVNRETIRETVSASGTMTGKDTANLKFLAAGRLAYIKVKAGDIVNEGDLIAGLDTTELNINLQKTQNSLAAAQAAVDKVIDDIHLYQYGNGGQSNVGTSNETEAQRNTRIAEGGEY